MTAATPAPAPVKRLTRSKTDRWLAGVCGGLAQYLGLDPTVVRIAWVLLSIFPGSIIGGLIVYLVWALIVPEDAVLAPPPVAPPQAPPPSPPMQG